MGQQPLLLRQIPIAIEKRGVFYKQSMAGFYPTSCELLASTMVQTVLTVGIVPAGQIDSGGDD